jgi:diadenosine tetraphosphate (Ap4A) HIT family hydrolase
MPNGFELDTRLADDCLILGKLDLSLLLLMNNSLVPWFILVPNTNKTEMTDLPLTDQDTLLKEINLISGYIKANYDTTKLNIAAIGNIVNQLHVHIVGRDPSDYCWPNVVWGRNEKEPYTDKQVLAISTALAEQLGNNFSSYS